MRRMRRSAVVVTIATVTTMGLTGIANAKVFEYGVSAQNDNTGLCLMTGTATGMTTGCGGGNSEEVNLVSSWPDAGNHAYVEIQSSYDPSLCLTINNYYQGEPVSVPSNLTDWETCTAAADQIWAMSNARPAIGHLHFEQFFNFEYYECLDGGFEDAYGFNENGCNPSNTFQIWEIDY